MHSSHVFKRAWQQPNGQRYHYADPSTGGDHPDIAFLNAGREVGQGSNRPEYCHADFDDGQNADHDFAHAASKSRQHATNLSALKLPLIRPLDVVLLGSIVALGMFIMAVMLGVL